MELRQLRHFVALAEEGSITAAAKRELVVQSVLGSSIQSLERELGVELYVRGTRPIRLTAVGQALEVPARRTVVSAAQAEQAVRNTQEAMIGTLRMGISMSAQHAVPFADYLGEFAREHPGVDVRLHGPAGPAMIEMVESGELDCAIGPASAYNGRLRLTPLAREPLQLVCREDHPLADYDKVTVPELADERFVELPALWTSRVLSDAAFAAAGVFRRIVCEIGDWEMFLDLVRAGVGIGFAPVGLPYPALTRPDSVLRLVRVADVHLERHIHLILPPVAETSPLATAFAALMAKMRDQERRSG
jgi:DNA-binding transcriptional LysR family regulator